MALAGSIMLSNIGQSIVMLADNMMVGHLGRVPLGVASFSGMIVMNFIVLGMGFAIGLTPLVGKKIVRNKKNLCIGLFANSLIINTVLGVTLSSLLLLLLPFMGYFGQPQEVVDTMTWYYVAISLSVIPYMIFLSFKQFLEGLGNTSVAMIITIVCNVLNIILNYVFIYGKLGFPEMGVFGAGLATLISRLSMPIIFYFYQKNSIYKTFIPRINYAIFNRRMAKLLVLFGSPIAGQMVVEFFSLTMITVMMGWLGVVELAANQICYSIMSMMYLVVSGIASALTIRVAFEYGKQNTQRIKKYIFSGVQMSVFAMGVSAFFMIVFGVQIASLFTNDTEVIQTAAIMMSAVGFAQVFDGTQITLLGALRGVGDVKAPMYIAFVMYGIVCLAVAYTLGFIFEWGAVGVWLGFGAGLFASAIMYGTRLKTFLSKK